MKGKLIKVDFTKRGKDLRELKKNRQVEKNYERVEARIRKIVNN